MMSAESKCKKEEEEEEKQDNDSDEKEWIAKKKISQIHKYIYIYDRTMKTL